MISKAITIVMINMVDKPQIKQNSAMFSWWALIFSLVVRIDRNEKMQLPIRSTVAMAVTSSMAEPWLNFKTFKDVSTIKQRPSKLEEELRIWDDLLFTTLPKLGC